MSSKASDVFPSSPLFIDFVNDHRNYSRKNALGKKDLLLKAIGISKGLNRVLDLTCGLAKDAVFLAQNGCSLLCFERSQEVFRALEDAHQRLILSSLEWKGRIKFVHLDSRDYLSKRISSVNKSSEKAGIERFTDGGVDVDVVYIDPMFSQKRKRKALPNKSMQLLGHLVGEDDDAEELLILSQKIEQVQRIVVKRSDKAPLLGGDKYRPFHSFLGSTVRYDVYTGQDQKDSLL